MKLRMAQVKFEDLKKKKTDHKRLLGEGVEDGEGESGRYGGRLLVPPGLNY